MARYHTVKPRLALNMPKKISDVAIERVPSLRNRISSFQSKLAIAHYAHGTITDYCHALYKAIVYIGKLPDGRQGPHRACQPRDSYRAKSLPQELSEQE